MDRQRHRTQAQVISQVRGRRAGEGVKVAVLGLAMVLSTSSVSGCGRTDGSAVVSGAGTPESAKDRRAYGLAPDVVPHGFRSSSQTWERTEPEDSVTEPLTARVFVRAGVRYLRLDGSHDALEAWVPMGSGEPLQFGPNRGSLTFAEGRAFLMVAREGIPADVVDARTLIITEHDPGGQSPTAAATDRSSLIAAALSLAPEQPAGAGPVASGDLAPYVNAVSGNLVKYLRDDGAQIEVHTFPGHHLDPIIEFFSPQIRRIDIGDQTGYVFGGEQGDDGATLATAGPSGDLVIVSATQAGIDIEQLIDMTQNLVER